MPTENETLDLQEVLTRYVDSCQGYEQVAELMGNPGLVAPFLEIAARRREVGLHIARVMVQDGEEADVDGSTEGALHRWWIRLREKVASEEFQVVLAECLRGEKVLAAALRRALKQEDEDSKHRELLQEAVAEVDLAISHFELAIGTE